MKNRFFYFFIFLFWFLQVNVFFGKQESSKLLLEEIVSHEIFLRNRKDPRFQLMEFPNGNAFRRSKAERFSLVDLNNFVYPDLVRIPINSTMSDLSRCIIIYVSMQFNKIEILRENIYRVIESLKRFGYSGHLIYRIGGWPNMEDGCLSHCHVPYGFKACAFKEVVKLGYKKVIWMDSIMQIIKPLNLLFDWVERNNCLYRFSYYPLSVYANDLFIESFNLKKEELETIPHIATGIIGLNLENENVLQFIEAWHESVLQENGYFSFFPDQLPFSILMKKYGLINGIYSDNLVKIRDEKLDDCFFSLDY